VSDRRFDSWDLNPTINNSQDAGSGFSIMGGATSDLITGEDPETPSNDQLSGMISIRNIYLIAKSPTQKDPTKWVKMRKGVETAIISGAEVAEDMKKLAEEKSNE